MMNIIKPTLMGLVIMSVLGGIVFCLLDYPEVFYAAMFIAVVLAVSYMIGCTVLDEIKK